MSALPPKADIRNGDRYVRFVPLADIHKQNQQNKAAPSCRDRPVMALAGDAQVLFAYFSQ